MWLVQSVLTEGHFNYKYPNEINGRVPYPLVYLSLSYYIPETWQGCPFWAGSARIGQRREYTPLPNIAHPLHYGLLQMLCKCQPSNKNQILASTDVERMGTVAVAVLNNF